MKWTQDSWDRAIGDLAALERAREVKLDSRRKQIAGLAKKALKKGKQPDFDQPPEPMTTALPSDFAGGTPDSVVDPETLTQSTGPAEDMVDPPADTEPLDPPADRDSA